MALIALINDTHAGIRGDSSLWYRWQKKFYDEVFFPTLDKYNIDHVIHGGDLLDRRKFINFRTLNRVHTDFLDPLRERGIKVDLIVGNHDVAYKNTNELNSPELLIGQDQLFRIHTEPVELPQYNMILVPWINNENYDRVVEAAQKSTMRTCYGHFEFAGFELSPGHIHQDGLSPSLFGHFETVMSGHYHTQSQSGNVHYLGAPFEFTWIDFNDPKGFWLFDTETLEKTFIHNPYTIFAKVDYHGEGQYDLHGADTIEDLTDKIVHLVVHDKVDMYVFDQFEQRVRDSGAKEVQVTDNVHIAAAQAIDIDDVDEYMRDTPTLIREYIEQIADIDEGTQKRLKSLMDDLYMNVQ